jgi:hypothetical protein
MRRSVLTPHPVTPCSAVNRIEVGVRLTGMTLELRYTLEGDVAHLLIPAQSSPRRADKLWQHTCFEAFVAEDPAAGYCEFNLSPSTEWAIYRFSSYREGMTLVEPHSIPAIRVQREPGAMRLEADVDLIRLAALRDGADLQLGLCAVIEDSQQRLSYWALAHPAPKPDFHHAGGFVLALRRDGSGSPRLTTGGRRDA